MPDTYTPNLGLALQATGDKNWGVTVNGIISILDGQTAIGAGAVQAYEHPASTSLNIQISAAAVVKGDGTALSYAGEAPVAMTANQFNYVYLDSTATRQVNTTGFPAGANIIPLAIVDAGATSITSITDARLYLTLSGLPRVDLSAMASANTFVAGPTTGSPAAPGVRPLVLADLPAGAVSIPTGGSLTPTAGSGAGTGGTAGVTGDRYTGEVTITTGSSPATGTTVVSFTPDTAYASVPRAILLTNSNAPAAGSGLASLCYVTSISTAGWSIAIGSSGLNASSTYKARFAVVM